MGAESASLPHRKRAVTEPLPDRPQPASSELIGGPTGCLPIIIGGQNLDDGIAHPHVRGKPSSQRPVPSHLSPKLGVSLAGEILRKPSPVCIPLGDLNSLHLRLGSGLCRISLALRFVEAGLARCGKRVPKALQKIGLVGTGLKVIPVPLGQGLPVVEGRDGCVSDPAIRVARKPPQRPGAGIWAEGHLEADLGIGRAGIFSQTELRFEHRGVERIAPHTACSGHHEQGFFGIKRSGVGDRVFGSPDLARLIT